MRNYVTPGKSQSVRFEPRGVWNATIIRVDTGTNEAWVRVPRLSGDLDRGPLQMPSLAAPLAVGDDVLVAFREGKADQLAIVARLGVSEGGGGGPVVLDGDVVGGSGATVVEAIQGNPVSTAEPSAGEVLKWDGAEWAPAADEDSAATLELSGDVTGATSATVVEAIQGYSVASNAPSPGDILIWDGTSWVPGPSAFLSVTLSAGVDISVPLEAMSLEALEDAPLGTAFDSNNTVVAATGAGTLASSDVSESVSNPGTTTDANSVDLL